MHGAHCTGTHTHLHTWIPCIKTWTDRALMKNPHTHRARLIHWLIRILVETTGTCMQSWLHWIVSETGKWKVGACVCGKTRGNEQIKSIEREMEREKNQFNMANFFILFVASAFNRFGACCLTWFQYQVNWPIHARMLFWRKRRAFSLSYTLTFSLLSLAHSLSFILR